MGAGQRQTIAVIGAGQAGAQTVQSLRAGGFDGRLHLFGEEGHAPYQRPPLSKKYLSGELAVERLALLPETFFAENDITCDFANGVLRIDAAERRLELADGSEVRFDQVLLATGSRPRPLPVPGVDHDGVFQIRNLADVHTMRPKVGAGGRAIIIGAGYIGLEVAASCRALGHEVVILEGTARVMSRTTSAIVGRYFEALHRQNGVDIALDTKVIAIDKPAHGGLVVETDKGSYEGDWVLVGIGAVANDGLAQRAGLAVDDGIIVDESCRSSVPGIYAAGDCTRFPSARYGRRLKLESVQNAIDQAKAAAQAMLGHPVVYDPVPWFWSDQFDAKFQIAGLSQFADQEIIRGDPASGSFSVAYLERGRLIAVDAVNRPRDYMQARRVVPSEAPVNEMLLRDPDVGINEAVVAGGT